MSEGLYRFSGLNGVKGGPLFPDMTAEQLAALALGRPLEEENLKDLRQALQPGLMGLMPGLDARNLSQAGWGVLYAEDDPEVDAIRDALQPLLEHRRSEAAAEKEHLFREYVRDMGYRAGDTKGDWLARQAVGIGPVDPDFVPYYLLIVGSPELIPFSFQYQLDVQYAVGRVCFKHPDDYRRYAESVVATEKGEAARQPRAVFFAPRHEGDWHTEIAERYFVSPLAAALPSAKTGWEIDVVSGQGATKQRLGRLLGGEDTPSLLLTVGHGVCFPSGYEVQEELQGELVCADWPSRGELIEQSQCFSARDVSPDARLTGLIGFHFACFSGGTPALDDFMHEDAQTCKQLAPKDFVACLPQRLLAHRNGSLAFVGHVEKAWEWSFYSEDAHSSTIQAFVATFQRLLEGYPLGAAMEFINNRYAELASDLNSETEAVRYRGAKLNATRLANLWVATNDCRNYAVFGDPAVRLRVGAG